MFNIREIEEGKTLIAPTAPKVEAVKPVEEVKKVSVTKASISNPLAKLAMTKPTAPAHPLEFSSGHPQNLYALDSEIIKLTAQFTGLI